MDKLEAFKKATPAVVNDLVKCKAFNGKKSCCTKDFTD